MLTTTKAIVLGAVKVGEAKMLVPMFTKEFGMLTFVHYRSSRQRRGGKGNLLQPLGLVEVEFDKRPKADIHSFRDVRCLMPMASIASDAHKLSIAIFTAELLKYALSNEQANAQLFAFVEKSVEWLETSREGFANFHIVFALHLLRFLGFHPNVDSFSDGSLFDLRDGVFTHLIPSHNDVVQPREAALVPKLARLSFATMHLLRLSRLERNQCTEQILAYYRLHLPCFPELRSFAVLQELF